MFSRLKLVIIAIALIGFAMPPTRGLAKEYLSAIEQERKVERGRWIVVRNEFGDIRIAGSDRNTVEAVATDRNSPQAVPVSIVEGSSGNKRVLTVSPVANGRGVQQITLEVKVPHDVELEPIYIRKGNISVIDFDGGVNLRTDDGNINVNRAGSAGGGLVQVMTWSGSIDLSNIKGDVRIIGISSNITVRCIKGDIAARVTSGQIAFSNTAGDVDANVSSGVISFTGAIHPEGRYRLKTLSGNVSMQIPDTVGFTAVLSAYNGQIHTDFPDDLLPSRSKQRIIGNGDGRARIELDSFSGSVELRKIVASNGTDCQK